jgi:hypothetical protein
MISLSEDWARNDDINPFKSCSYVLAIFDIGILTRPAGPTSAKPQTIRHPVTDFPDSK